MRKHLTSASVIIVLSAFITGCSVDIPNTLSGSLSNSPTHKAVALLNQVKQLREISEAVSKHKRNTKNQETVFPNGIIFWGMRKFPYPYKAMLAIASDADHETLRKFNLVHEFLNTNDMTPMGKGVGLDIADSFFMYNGSNLPEYVDVNSAPISKEFTYFKGTSSEIYGGNIIDAYIHDGWLDSIHTYGDFSMVNPHETKFNRKLAIQAIHALELADDHVSVWIDHGNQSNVDNFGSFGKNRFYSYQQGANPNSPYYHTDLLIPYGIKFVWTDGNDTSFGHYSMLYPITLPDGQKVWGFWRYTNSGYSRNGTPEWMWSPDNLAKQLSWKNLKSIIWLRQYAIIAQHLCGNNSEKPLPENAVQALRFLAREYHDGNILVARTSRLLQYNLTQQFLQYYATADGDKLIIHITAIKDPVFGTHVPTIDELRGVTFYTSEPQKTEIEIGNVPVSKSLIQYNPKDNIAPSISIKWFPPDTTNYAITDPAVF